MEVGSIVQCVKASDWQELTHLGIVCPKVGEKYMVRGIWRSDAADITPSLYLEEIKNSVLPFYYVEPSFEIECFRELIPPMDIMEALAKEEVEQLEYEGSGLSECERH